MCEPVSAALAIVSVVSQGANMIAQAKAAKMQKRSIEDQLDRTMTENRDAASVEMFDRAREARREQAKIRTAAGEAGLNLGSGSIEGLLFDSAMQMELAQGRTMANLESRNEAAKAEADSMASQISKPTVLGAGLQLAATGLQGFSNVQNANLRLSRASEVSSG